jgi:hypothetical protein
MITRPRRYTWTVSWRQFVSVLVLAILTGLPVSRATCAVLCASPANSSGRAEHHSSTLSCEKPARADTGIQIRGVSDHGCDTHQTAVRQAAVAATERVAGGLASVALVTTLVWATFTSSTRSGSQCRCTTPPGPAPPTTTPRVLRV